MDFKNFAEVDDLTMEEYSLLMKAAALRQADLDYRNHLQAFLNFAVQAEKKVGKNKTKPVYNRFEKFYDREKEINRVLQKKPENRFNGIGELLKRGESNE